MGGDGGGRSGGGCLAVKRTPPTYGSVDLATKTTVTVLMFCYLVDMEDLL